MKAKWRQRLRGITKWSGVTLCVVLFALWFESRWLYLLFTVGCPNDWLTLCWYSGVAQVIGPGFYTTHPQFMTLEFGPNDEWMWWFWDFNKRRPWGISVPGWLPFLLFALPTGFLFWSDHRRRMRAGCCEKCGYNLTGNTSGKCPECGSPANHLQFRKETRTACAK